MLNAKKIFIFIGLQVLLVSPHNVAFSEDFHVKEKGKSHIHGAHKECALPKNTMDIVDCALAFHPSVKRAKLGLESAIKLEEKAAQILNPILSSRYVKGEKNGENISELEANLSFTLELGGKRSSRKNFAQASKSNVMAMNEITKSEIKINTIIKLYRLRQILSEKEIVKEALKAFSKVISQLKKLPRLSAEQEASLTLFEMAYEETRINESEFFEEERELEHYFHIATGHSLKELQNFLPKTPKEWPRVRTDHKSGSSPEMTKLKSLTLLAQNELEIQKSNAWPSLKLGPSIAIERDGDVENKMVGFNIQIPFPLFQLNGGAKAFAKSELIRAQKNVVFTQTEEDHERIEQLRIYESAVRILNKTMKQDVIVKKQKRIEKLYLRGVISSSVLLDSLKLKLSYLKSRNLRELTAINALWNIYKYDGKIFKENL
jgi:outer membrane protein, heavy metal efflux system